MLPLRPLLQNHSSARHGSTDLFWTSLISHHSAQRLRQQPLLQHCRLESEQPRVLLRSRRCSAAIWPTPLSPQDSRVKKNSKVDQPKPRKAHHKTEWKTRPGRCPLDSFGQGTRRRTNVLAEKISRHYRSLFSAALIATKKSVSQKGEQTLYQRLSTPRPAPRIILKNVWNQQHQQQQQQQCTFCELLQTGPGQRTTVVGTVILKGAHVNMLQKKMTRFQSISGFMENHKRSYTRIRKRMTKNPKHWLISCKLSIKPDQSSMM